MPPDPRLPHPSPHLSVSQVTTYLSCARRYRFRYVEGREPESKSDALAFGSALHASVEWWQAERIAGRAPPVDRLLRTFRADWTAATADPDLDLDGKDPAEMLATGQALLRLFAERFAAEAPPRVVEQRFEVELRHPATGEALPVPLVGYLDAAGDGLVWELKTASRKNPVSDYNLQLSAYAYAVRESTGRSPRVRVVQLVKTKAPKIEVEEVEPSLRDQAWFAEVTCEVFEAIACRAFPPNPSWRCPTCEYRGACRSAA